MIQKKTCSKKETRGSCTDWIEKKEKREREREMSAWCNNSSELIIPKMIPNPSTTNHTKSTLHIRTITCPSCGHNIQFQDQGGIHDLPGLPAGVKFDPNDGEILEHLEAKVRLSSDAPKLHPLIDEFIPSLEGENGICYTHPEKLPGVSKDGQIRHFFHRPSKAYTTGTRKRRKVHTEDEGSETRWHKTGKTRPISVAGTVKGFKKILVLYTNYGRQKKPEKTNWVMHQYHLGANEEERDGELVVSKVFYQTQPRQCGNSVIVKDPYEEIMLTRHVSNNYNNNNNNEMTIMPKNNTAGLNNLDYYSPPPPPPSFMNYEPQLIPNMVVQGDHDSSSFIRLAMDHANRSARMDRK